MTREEAWELLCEYTPSESLRRHGLAVEACMRWYARYFQQDDEAWGLAGLLHDFDYERFPEPPAHTREGAKILRARELDEEVVSAILSHVDWNQEGCPRDRPIRKTLFAVDELAGFITACALIRPTLIEGLTAGSVLKKLKTPSFAAAVSRADIDQGAALLGLPLEEHVHHCIAAMTGSGAQLGLLK